MSDITVTNFDSFVLVMGASQSGAAWLDDNLDPDATRWGNGYCVEPRYLTPILEGAVEAGLEVEAS